ncbi:MAG: tatA [Gemmatimonadetes bacterium]|nr:tatA [Gemmatimonadota bacterium]
MFGNLGFGELMIILVIVLVLFGAKRIPEISASFGKGIREFKKNVNDVERSITEPEARTEPRLSAGEPVLRREASEEARPEPKRLF